MSKPPRGPRGGRTSAPYQAPRGARGGARTSALGGGNSDTGSSESGSKPRVEGKKSWGQHDSGSDSERRGGRRGRGQGARGRTSSPANNRINGLGAQASAAKIDGNHPGMSKTVPRDYNAWMDAMKQRLDKLKDRREAERKMAIRDGFLADPTKQRSLADAITPVGTGEDMCPEFERVTRIAQNMAEPAEKVWSEDWQRTLAKEAIMVKAFRRPAAGEDEQLPSDIRTPETLQRTLNYLLDDLVGGEESLASIHKFVWDRTRGIRNDFSIQQVSKLDDVRIAVDCFERIARFHVISLHQLSNPDNRTGDEYDAHQDREQLNNTLLSLMYYYDDFREQQEFKNEAELRAYCVLFAIQDHRADMETRMQSWPQHLLKDKRVQMALKLYQAAGNTSDPKGPLTPPVPLSVAQSNYARFWSLVSSNQVSYMMACVAEMNFAHVRYTALQSIWQSYKRGLDPRSNRNDDWTVEDLKKALGFDSADQTESYCQEHGIDFKSNPKGQRYLDFASQADAVLDKSDIDRQQVFSHQIVEKKRFNRTLVTVINGVSATQAIREGMVESLQRDGTEQDGSSTTHVNEDSSMFVGTDNDANTVTSTTQAASSLNPVAPTFSPGLFGAPTTTTIPSTGLFGVPSGTQPSFGVSQPSDGDSLANKTIFGTPTPTQDNPFSFLTKPATSEATAVGAPAAAQNSPFSFLPKAAAPEAGATTGRAEPGLFGPLGPVRPFPAFNFGQPDTQKSSGNSAPTSLPAQPVEQQPIFSQAIPKAPTFPSQPPPTASLPNQPVTSDATPQTPPSSPRPGHAQLPSFARQEPAPPAAPFNFTADTASPATLSNGKDTSNAPPFAGLFGTTPPIPPSTSEQAPSTTLPIPKPFDAPPYPGGTPKDRPFTSPVVNTEQAKPTPKPFNPYADASRLASSTVSTAFLKPTHPESDSRSSSDEERGRQHSAPGMLPPPQRTKSAIPSILAPQIPPSTTRRLFSTKPTRESSPLRRPPLAADNQPPKTYDKNVLATDLARIAMVEPGGLLDQFIRHEANKLIKNVIRQYKTDQSQHQARIARADLLGRKYFLRWKALAWENQLNRRAKSQRKLISEAMRDEREKEAQEKAELEVALLGKKRDESLEQARISVLGTMPPPPPLQNHGRKRKSMGNDRVDLAANGLPRKIKAHKRSRTLGNAEDLASTKRTHSSPPHQLDPSIFDSRSIIYKLGDSVQARKLFAGGRKMDTTTTDYFRLKAMGIDPDTPVVPETKKSLERKRKSEEWEEKVMVTGKKSRINIERRDNGHTTKTTMDGAATSKPVTSSTQKSSSKAISTKASTTATTADDDDEALFAELRQLRESLAEGATWYQSENQQLSSSPHAPTTTTATDSISPQQHLTTDHNGLSKVNGYTFSPSTSGIMTRTEQRLRRTGGKGFAYKPVPHNIRHRDSDLEDTGEEYTPAEKSKKREKGKNKQRISDAGPNTRVWHGRLRSSSPETHDRETSQQSQPTGASADDAFVLSD